ncbi:MAG: hypothetical protein PHQ93_09270 [Sulfurimonas sp.]|uniref:hypothetical protein n=1 Tax=Sulfurimonas sp. TaxID=2022749 RepID=UPI002637D914|nr:hypothetical protein [Sulfurimonas sp.]MDD5401362.1 hypothetical protein [Sulfurimonas sp.]
MMCLNKMVDENDYQGSFNKIANYLLNCVELQVKTKKYEFTEIEFYYYSDDHKDCALHGDELQKTSNGWYVHNKGRGGIDITFGNCDNFGGILIRGIKEVKSDGKYIDGPLNIMNFFKSQFSCQNKMEIQDKLTLGIIAFIQIDCKNDTVYQGPRIGLVQPTNPYLVYPYRFLKDLSKEHNFKEKLTIYYTSIKLGITTKENISNNIGYQFSVESYENTLSLSINKNRLFLDYFKNI